MFFLSKTFFLSVLKHASSMGPFVSYKSNEMLWILLHIHNTSFFALLKQRSYKLECLSSLSLYLTLINHWLFMFSHTNPSFNKFRVHNDNFVSFLAKISGILINPFALPKVTSLFEIVCNQEFQFLLIHKIERIIQN